MKNNKVIWQTILTILQTLTGLFLAGFMIFHVFGNSLINFGENVFNSYASHLDHSNALIQIGILLIITVGLIHGLNGLRIAWRYFKKTPSVWSFLSDTKYRGSVLWYAHFTAGIIIGITAIVHLIVAYLAEAEPITTAEIIRERLQNNYYFALMILLLISVVFHICYGLRTVSVKYGVLTKHQRKIEIILVVVAVVLVIIGVNNLLLFKG